VKRIPTWLWVVVALSFSAFIFYFIRFREVGGDAITSAAEQQLGPRSDDRAVSEGPPTSGSSDVATRLKVPPTEEGTTRASSTQDRRDQPTRESEAADPDEYARLGAITAEHQAWLKRNKYPNDAQVALLMAMDVNSLRALVLSGELAAQTELAYRLSRDTGTQREAGELFKDAVVKGSKEALTRLANSEEQGGLCSNAVAVNAHLQVAVMLGDLSAMPKYVQCAHSMSPQDHGFSLVLAAKIYSQLNQEAVRRTGRPLQLDLHPLTDEAINTFINATQPDGKNGG